MDASSLVRWNIFGVNAAVGQVFISPNSFTHFFCFNAIGPQDLFPKGIRLVKMILEERLTLTSILRVQESFSSDVSSVKAIFGYQVQSRPNTGSDLLS